MANENKTTDPAYENEALGQGARFLVRAVDRDDGGEKEGGPAGGYSEEGDNNDEHSTEGYKAGAANNERIANLQLILAL